MKKQSIAFCTCLVLLHLFASKSFASPLINEFSSADSSDWIEIFNLGTEPIDLSQYRLRDLTSNNKLDLSGSLAPSGFATFDWSNKLNNGGDLIKLVLSSDDSVVDQVSYGDQGGISTPSQGQSGGRKSDGAPEWALFTTASKNTSNNSSSTFSPPTTTPTKTPTPTKSPTPTKTATAAKTSSAEAKTPTPKVSLTSNSNAVSTKIATSAKITTYSKPASQFAVIKSLDERENKEEVKVLGTKDSDFSFAQIAFGILLFAGACSWFVYKNIEQIKLWIKK